MTEESTQSDGSDDAAKSEESTAEEKAATEAAAEAAAAAAKKSDDGTVLTDKDGPQGAPETYADFDLPGEMTLDEGMMKDAAPIFKDLGLSQIQAQKLVNFYAGNIQATSQASSESYDQQLKDWVTEAKNDKEIGGEAFDENVGAAKRAIDKFGTPELITVLNDTGLGSHPEVIRLFTRISKLITEDDPGGSEAPKAGDRTQAQIMYPNADNKSA